MFTVGFGANNHRFLTLGAIAPPPPPPLATPMAYFMPKLAYFWFILCRIPKFGEDILNHGRNYYDLKMAC